MSTKIFVHVPRKIKPPKPPDPAIELEVQREREEAERRKARHAESKRLQAERRRQELDNRPAPPPPPPPPPRTITTEEFEDWAREHSVRILMNNHKWMKQLKNVAHIHQGTMSVKTFANIHDELTIRMVRAAEADGLPADDKAVENLASLTAVTILGVADEFCDIIEKWNRDAEGRGNGDGPAGGEEKSGPIHFENRRPAKLA